MELCDVHSCSLLYDENGRLKRKLKKYREKNLELETQLKKKEEKEKIFEILRDHVTTRNIMVQTDCLPSPSQQPDNRKEDEKKQNMVVRMASMQQNVRNLYEKELRKNNGLAEDISKLKLTIKDLESKIKHLEDNLAHMEKQNANLKQVSKNVSVDKMKELKKRCLTLEAENKKFKKELSGLDAGFFEEIEDLKYSLFRSSKLTKQYEKALQRLCFEQGIPFPKLCD